MNGFNPYIFISICSLLISLITMVFLIFGHKHTQRTDFIAQLETRVEALERELKDAKDHITRLEEKNGSLITENIELLRKIARMSNGTK